MLTPPVSRQGFTLVETLVAAAILAVLTIAIYQSFSIVIGATVASRSKVAATLLANEELEVLRSLPYGNVGIMGGVPAGVVPREESIARDGISFLVTRTIRNVDDPYDGTIDGSPADTAPADYKLVQVTVACEKCADFTPIELATTIAPLQLEGLSANGAIFARVIDATGVPISGVTVRIVNNDAVPAIDITDVTDGEGRYQLVDAPPGELSYDITVSKAGYSTGATHEASVENPDPVLPPATVVAGQVTQIGFSVDRTATLDIATVSDTCETVANAEFSIRGDKLIGGEPETDPVYKYNTDLTTSVDGILTIEPLEWDTYGVRPRGAVYDIVGTTPAFPVAIAPASATVAKLVMREHDPAGLLVRLRDLATEAPVPDAEVRLSRGSFVTTEQSTSTSLGGCEPEGSVFFGGLDVGGAPYVLTVTHPSYQTVVDDSIDIPDAWQEVVFSLSPQ